MNTLAVTPGTVSAGRSFPCARGGARAVIGWTAVGALLLAGALGARERLEGSASSVEDRAELTYFPAGPWVRVVSLGHTSLAADLVWLRAIQYYGEHRRTDRDYPFVDNLFETLFLLDPAFENGYLFGALVLVGDLQDLDGALQMLQRGIDANPSSWRLVFEYGFFCYVHAKDPDRAAPHLARAAAMEGAPDWVRRLAAYSAKKAGRREMAIALWIEIFQNTENAEIQRVAAQYLAELGVAEYQEIWQALSGEDR